MSRVRWVGALCGALMLLGAGVAQAAPRWGVYHRGVCAALTGEMHCMAQEATKSAGGNPLASSTPPTGSYGPAQLQGAYSLGGPAASQGAGETVAIVDAYNEPNIKSDINVYRKQYGIPAVNTTGNPSFTVVSQTGTTKLPSTDSGWGDEEALDVEMVSAICPRCNLVLVEASSPTTANLNQAELTAQKYTGVVAVSNSWGGSEASNETTSDANFGLHPTTVSAGDSGTGAAYPATSPNVTAVGGTTLNVTGNATTGYTRSSEAIWTGTGSGCSAYEPAQAFQTTFTGFPTGCGHRAEADVSADANPSTGVAVYDSCGDAWSYYFMPAPCRSSSSGYWQQFGGTSVAAPIIASVFALAGDHNNSSGNAADQFVYSHYSSASFYDVPSGGSNGSCSLSWVCNTETGYDGPTGLGTPNGTGGF